MVTLVADDLISRARSGDDDAFRELTEPHRRELQAHCYRMLGTLQDAEDAVQDTLLAAWQGLAGFEGRVLAAHLAVQDRHQPVPQRTAHREPAARQGVEHPGDRAAGADQARRGRLARAVPRCTARRGGRDRAAAGPRGPLRAGGIHLARLRGRPAGAAAPPARGAHPARCARVPRQRGGGHARLDRRVGQQRAQAGPCGPAAPPAAAAGVAEPPPAPGSPAEDAIVARFTSAYESADLDALVALLTDDVVHVDAAHATRIRGQGPGRRLLRPPVRRGPRHRPGADPRQRPARRSALT